MKTTQALKSRFSRALEAPGRLHFAAHSHHPWPDVSFEAQQRAWLEAAAELDFKWEHIFGDVIPAAQGHVARILGLSDPSTVVFGPNTHDFVKRVFSCVERKPVSVLTTDGEFHSFDRQSRRWDEAGLAVVERIPLEPFATFEDRFLERAESGEHDVIYVSQVFYGSGFVFGRFAELAERAPEDAIVVIDGYHGFFALPTDLSGVEGRFFYTAGGYKYAMSGEGVCFLHCPPGYGDRPVDTGWYAGFSELVLGTGAQVAYARDASRFFGATFDCTGLYRFVAVMDLWEREGLDVKEIHAHARALQERFLERLEGIGQRELSPARLVPDRSFRERGNFLTFRVPEAERVHRDLRKANVVTDHRGDRLRFGFGIYQDEGDVDQLVERVAEVVR